MGGEAPGAREPAQDRAQLGRALAALKELRVKLQAVESARREPIAVVGIGCRFPGGADSREAFWRLLRDGVDAVTDVRADRWDAAELYDPSPNVPGKAATRWGGFLEHVDRFDADFFGISPVEARRMDPQQRLLLEVTYEALEDGGQPLERWAGGRVGVFIGVHSHSNDYAWMQLRDLKLIGVHTGTGTAHSIVANRLSYCFDWAGPSLVVDTACSSSLVAAHLAVQSLRAGESDLAVAAGVNLMLTPEATVTFSKLQMMAGDGRCKTFDARADGFVRGEGCGVVVLRRLSDALADGDPILALIVGTAVNQDGATNGLTAPSGRSQVAVVREALENGGVDPSRVTYVEAHGTGTALGDPIEVEALAEVLGRAGGEPCVLGSVKTNIGHLEGAAGIAGLIKTVLALHHGEIPQNLHFRELNPHITLEGTRLELATSRHPWPAGTDRHAGVSSFGFGGTNAHVVLREAPARAGSRVEADGAAVAGEAGAVRPYLLPISARSEGALRSAAGRWAEFLEESEAGFADICRAAAIRRTHHEHRLAIVAETAGAAVERLREFGAGTAGSEVAFGRGSPNGRSGLTFVFTGQGQQWAGMGRDVMEAEPVFRAALEACDAAFRPLAGRSLLDDLAAAADASRLERTDVAQPLLFALQVALAELWKSWGIVPDAVVGHSLGEVSAAHVAGALPLADAIRIVHLRGQLMHRSAGRGRMVAVELGAAEAARVVAGAGGAVSVAAENGPSWTVLSGDADAVEAVVASLTGQGVTCRYLPGDYAFHSPQMDPYRTELVEALEGLRPAPVQIPMYSTVTGQSVGPGELTAEYWGRNMREPVRFAPAVVELLRSGHDTFVELGPHPALSAMVAACAGSEGVEAMVVPSLRRGRPGRSVMLQALAGLYARGFDPAWREVNGGAGVHVTLPRYAWQHRRFWFDKATAVRGERRRAAMAAEPSGAQAALPGRRLPTATPTYELRVEPGLASYMRAHRLDGDPVLPAAAYIELALAAAARSGGAGRHDLDDVAFHEALRLRDGEPRVVQVALHTDQAGGWSFEIHSAPEPEGDEAREWTLHASGRVRPAGAGGDAEPVPDEEPGGGAFVGGESPDRAADAVMADRFYRALAGRGIDLGAAFRSVERIWPGGGMARGRIRVPAEAADAGVRPGMALLDGAIQCSLADLAGASEEGDASPMYVAVGLERLRLHRALDGVTGPVWVEARDRAVEGQQGGDRVCDIRVRDDASATVAEIHGLRLRRIERSAPPAEERGEAPTWFYDIAWEEAPEVEDAAAMDSVLTASPGEIADRLAPRAEELGAEYGLDRTRGAEALVGIEALAASYAARALEALGIEREALAEADEASLAERCGVQARHRPLFRRVLELAGGEGGSGPEGGPHGNRAWKVDDPAAAAAALAVRYPEYAQEIGLLKRCGEALPAVLLGEVDPLELLFSSWAKPTAETLYHEAASTRVIGALAAEAVAAAVPAGASARPLRVLEIGAGTGGTTTHLVERLPADGVEYVFTDVARTLLERSRARFAGHGFMRFELLDIERPDGAAASAGPYDLVIAANVFHATRDLGETLKNVRRLLAPGGLLVAVETTARRGWLDLVFGLTEGWWRFADRAVRPVHALLEPDAWLGALEGAGFEEPVAVGGEAADKAVLPQTLLVARAPRGGGGAGCWAVFSQGSAFGHEVIDRLQRLGHEVVRVSPADRYDDADPTHLRIAPGSAEDYERLFAGPFSMGERALEGVIHLWAAEMEDPVRTGSADFDEAVRLGCLSPLLLARAMAAAGRRAVAEDAAGSGSATGRRPRLWLVTAGAQPVGREQGPTAVFQAPGWGMGRGIALQYPEHWGGLVDVSPGAADPEEAGRLVREVRSPGDEDQVAYRGGRRWVARLVRVDAPAAGSARIDPEASYLVTGGLGGVGREVARWLVRRGARHLVLTTRRPLPERHTWATLPAGSEEFARAALIQELEAAGATVAVAAVDAGDANAVAALLGRIESDGRRLAGIVHAAVDLEVRPLPELGPEALGSMMHAKARGAWILHELTRTRDVDFFVSFSSTTSWLGSRDLAHYAAANQFLDALAHHRAALGLPALSVNWGTWEFMRLFSAKQREVVERSGLVPMEAERALDALDRLIGERVVQCTVAAIDWPALRATYGARRSTRFFDRISDAPRTPVIESEPDGTGFRDRVVRLGPAEQSQAVAELVEGAVRAVLGIGSDEPIDPNRGLFDMGLDSLMAVQLKERLESATGERLPATLTLNYPTVAALAGHLVERCFDDTRVKVAAGDVGAGSDEAAIAEEVERMTDEESRRLLLEELRALGLDHDA